MMNRARNKSFLLIIGLFATGLLLAGCGSGGEDTGNTPPQEGSELTTFTFDLSSFSPQSDSGGTPAAIGDPAPSGGVEAKGAMLIVGPNGEQYLFSFNPFFDEAALTITATQVIKLDPGLYTFYMLLNLNIQGVTHQYAVIAPVLIFKAVENKVHLNLNPTLMFLNSVKDLRAFSRMTFDYPEDIKTWTHPRFGISIDAVNNGAEFFFNINKDTASGPVVIMLPSRSDPYIIKCRFYDGSLVRVVCPGSEEEVVLPPADQAPVEIEPVPLTAETTYSFTPSTGEETGEATFLFNIPKEIVTEIGGADDGTNSLSDRLLSVATLVGPENTLTEKILTLTPQINSETDAISFYQASITVSGFDPGTITWALNFFDIRNGGSEQFAYCALTVDVTSGTDPNHGSFLCDLQIIDRTLTDQYPLGTLKVSVSDGSLVSGAVVLVNDKPVGITGSSDTVNGLGTFDFFYNIGSHQVTAQHEIIDPYGSGKLVARTAIAQTIELTANSVQQVALILPPLAEPPKVTGSSPNQGATGVSVRSSVSITFSKPMEQGITEGAFTISPQTAGALSWSGDSTVLTFTPSGDLPENTKHVVTVGTVAKDTEGIPLQSAFNLEFTTGSTPDTVAPSVSSTLPANQSDNVSLETSIMVTFSEAMNTASAEAALSVMPALSGTFSWSGDNSVMTFVPGQSLNYSQSYNVTVAASAADTSGNTLAGATNFSFTTGVQPDETAPTVVEVFPANNAGDVAINARVTVEFSEKMDPATAEAAFEIKPTVAGSIVWSTNNVQMTFTPSQPLAYETAYTVTVGANAADTSGNSMGAAFSSVFTTANAPVAGSLTIVAAMTRRPVRRDDGSINLDAPIRIKIPPQLQVEIVNDEDGKPLGNSNRFLLFLYMGSVKCIYLGGKWERYIGWVPESITKKSFRSPSCNKGKQAGDIITVPQSSEDRDGDDEDGQFHLAGAEIKARVISGDPAFKETRIRVTISVVTD